LGRARSALDPPGNSPASNGWTAAVETTLQHQAAGVGGTGSTGASGNGIGTIRLSGAPATQR
jgi:hypothetical protein